MIRKTIVICIDGCGPEYIEAGETPRIDEIGQAGFFKIGRSVIPSVTNVNNVSIITGSFPETHGLTGNYYYDRTTGREAYMESPEFLLAPTVCEWLGAEARSNEFERGTQEVVRCAVLTSKVKLLRMLGRGADVAVAAERPPEEWVERVGPAADIYSAEINYWLLRAARAVAEEYSPDFMYVSTTDYMMHKFDPGAEESRRNMAVLDRLIGELVETAPDHAVFITADHGMSPKTQGIDIEKLLAREGILSRAIPIIKDRLMAHHGGLGGASYVYLSEMEQADRSLEILGNAPGVEEVLPAGVAAERYHLHPDRIGDLLVLGDERTVFGQFKAAYSVVELRSHGSARESAVPTISNDPMAPGEFEYNLDAVRRFFQRKSDNGVSSPRRKY